MEEEESELSSSSSSYSSSEDESVGEEEDEDSEEEPPVGSRSGGPEQRSGERGRRKRRRKLVGRRRELRSKYESVKDFNPEARSAQTEEIERIRRLELQRSLQGGTPTVPRVVTPGEAGGELNSLLGSGAVFRNLAEDEEERERVVDAIVISSDSEEEEEEEKEERERERLRRGEAGRLGEGGREVKAEPVEDVKEKKLGRYDVVGKERGDQVVINLGHPPDEEDVTLAPQIARIIKPHQVGGVCFLYDNLIESLTRFHTSTGFGCILAHSMGLGKTLQVITFIDIFFRYTPARHVLCVVPVNTLQNWVVEFDKWLPDKAQEEQKKKAGPGSSSTNKSSRTRNKKTQQQNGRGSKMADNLQPSLHPSAAQYPSLSNGLPATKDAVSMPTAVTGDNSSQLFVGGGVLSESDQQILLSHLMSSMDPSSGTLGPALSGGHTQTTPTGSGVLSGSRPHTPNPSTANSRSHTASPSIPDMQYRSFRLSVLTETCRTMEGRLRTIKQWREEGGVLLIGYEMYRLLSLSVPSLGGNKMAVKRRKTAKSNNQQNNSFVDLEENEREMEKLMEIQRALCNPGPDLMVCDEGHRIKNDYTNISQALKKIRTRRRVVLTGYPLQNNLLEYWCMVDFVRPKYLGTKQEFCDLFERPITNGQCVDSTAKDVRTMRYRSHVLHTLLKGFVLRRGHEILKSSLPMKFEHVLLVRPSPIQAALYDYNMNNLQQGGTSTTAGPLKAFAVCTKIWNHPDIYYNEAMKPPEAKKNSTTSWQEEVGLPKNLLPKGETNKVEWPKEVLALHPPYQTGRLDNSPKMVVAMEILDRSVQLGDKLLIFSQSLMTLSYIESLLVRRPIPIPHTAGPSGEVQYSGTMWTKNVNFCRLDGSTSSADRDKLITAFNSPANTEMWVFLLSTRAGCLGINLIGANRVIVLDVSWNPCYDAQAVCRVYRYGQTKPCHIYRLVCDGMMERKIYDRQISKQGMADRVVDELQPERHFTADEIITLMRPMAALPAPENMSLAAGNFTFDQVLYILCQHFGPLLTKTPFRHESLLLDSADEKMTEAEKMFAKREFQQDWNARKRNNVPQPPPVVHPPNPLSPQPPRLPGVASSWTLPPQPHPSSFATPPQPHPSSFATPLQPHSSLSVSSYSNTRVGLPSTTSVPISHAHLQAHSNPTLQYGHGSVPTSQYGHGSIPTSQYGHGSIPTSQYGHGSIPTSQYGHGSIPTSQYGHSSVPIPSSMGMGYGNTTVSNSIICLDSDSESDWSTQPPAHSSGVPIGLQAQATLLPGPKVLTVPLSSSLDSTHSHLGDPVKTGHAPYRGGVAITTSSPFNPAISQLAEVTRQEGVRNEGDPLFTSSDSFSTNSVPATGPVPVPESGGMGMRPQTGHTPGVNLGNVQPPSANPGQNFGQAPQYSGQPPTYSGQTGFTPSDINHQFTTPHSQSTAESVSSGQLQLSPTLTCLLNTTTNNNIAPSPQPQLDLPLSATPPPSSLSHQPPSAQNPAQPPLMLESVGARDPSRPPVQAGSTQMSTEPPQGLSLEPAASHSAHEITGSPSHPLFSPPKLPLHREAGGSVVSCVARGPTAQNSQPLFSSPPQPAQTGPSPPSSSPFPCSTPSPLSQPPTPSTSIPLLSPVAAHFFQVSMSKSPKPTPSPSHTPSPSPSSYPHPPLSSPPSVPTATSPSISKNRPTPLLT